MKSMVDRAVEVRRLVADNPGVKACQIAEQLSMNKATVSQVVAELRSNDEIKQVKKPGQKGLELYVTQTFVGRELLRKRWR